MLHTSVISFTPKSSANGSEIVGDELPGLTLHSTIVIASLRGAGTVIADCRTTSDLPQAHGF